MWSLHKDRFKKLICFKNTVFGYKIMYLQKELCNIVKNIAECMQMYIRTHNFFHVQAAISTKNLYM